MTYFGVLKDAIVSVDGTEYQATVKTAMFTPTTNTQTYPVMVPEGAIQDVDNAVWTLQVVGLQDWGASGLSKYLKDNHGTQVDVTVTPVAVNGWPEINATVICMSPPFGGTAGEFAEMDVTLPVVGQPAFANASL